MPMHERSQEIRNSLGLVREDEFAKSLNVTTETLAAWRKEKTGPDYVKLGRSIYYRQSDIVDWVNASVQSVGRLARRVMSSNMSQNDGGLVVRAQL